MLGGKPRYYFAFWTRFVERLHTERPSWRAACDCIGRQFDLDAVTLPDSHLTQRSFPLGGKLSTKLYIGGGDAVAKQLLIAGC